MIFKNNSENKFSFNNNTKCYIAYSFKDFNNLVNENSLIKLH